MTAALDLARRYFDLSNARDLDEIETLFTASSTYSSDNTGVYLGVDQIIAMQRAFFAGFADMNWTIHSAEEIRAGVVLFDFTFSGMTLDGERIDRPGWETVAVFEGKLQHVEVRNKN